MRMEAVDGAVDGHRYVLVAHLVEERGHSGGGDVGRTRRDGLANVTNIGAILVGGILVAQLFKYLTATIVLSAFVAVKNSRLIIYSLGHSAA